MGYGKSERAIIVTHVAKWSERSVPPKDGWKSRKVKIKHFKVTQRSSLTYSLEQTERYSGSHTSDGGLICLKKKSSSWILIERSDPNFCDRT